MIDDLNLLYNKYNNKNYIHPDPYEFVGLYSDDKNKEIVGLISASFAVGNVFQIIKFIKSVLQVMGDSPFDYLIDHTPNEISRDYQGYYYRYYKDFHIIEFFLGIKKILETHGTLENWVMSHYNTKDDTYFPVFKKMSADFNLSSALIPKSSGSMVRKDNVDIGIWKGLTPSKLVIPLDIHMLNISKILGFTTSKSNSMSNALKITSQFKNLSPEDPTKWDFCLSRLGIHPDLDYKELIFSIKKEL